MKKLIVLLSGICISMALLTACGVNDNERPQIYGNNPGDGPLINNRDYNDPNNNLIGPNRNDGDSPLRNDPEYNDPDNNIL
ncbi:MAG: hypothetical protein WD907_00310, partial [Bacilli bacterium]